MEDSTYFFATAGGTALIAILAVWSAVWKGIALWKAGRNNHLTWYVILFLLNTAGILEIIYIFTAGKKKEEPVKMG